MRLTADAVAEIRASEGVYRAADVARAYEVHRSTVVRIWAGSIHEGIECAPEPPNIITTPRPVDLEEDIRLLTNRGYTPEKVASTLGISVRSVYMHRGVFV
jgi:DNA invertase Pin-like site-specific DNA recombinase